MAGVEKISDLDLPLHSNIEDIRVSHYNIELTCDMKNKVFSGSVILLLAHEKFAKPKGQVLQCTQIEETEAVDGLEHIETAVNQRCMEKIDITERENMNYGESSKDRDKYSIKAVHNREETQHNEQGCTESVDINLEYHDSAGTNQGSINAVKQNVKETFSNRENGERVDTTVEEQAVIKFQNAGLESANSHVERATDEDISQDMSCKDSDTLHRTEVSYDKESPNSHVGRATDEDLSQDMSFKDSDTLHRTELSYDHNYTKELHEHRQIHEPDFLVSKLDGINKPGMKEVRTLHTDFVMVLDAWDLTVTSVQEISIQNTCDSNNAYDIDKTRLNEVVQKCDKNSVEFCSEKTCLRFWKPEIKSANEFPRCIQICYQTQTCGPSLKWTKDQDGRPCVFTHGHWINNRSLFPSQDVPGALATWRAYIHVPEGMTVLMSGDQNPEIKHPLPDTNLVTYIYHTDLEVPSSTLALAVGYWEKVEIISHLGEDSETSGEHLPCRLFTPILHKDIASTLLCPYIPRCMAAAVSLLGPHPFKRLDILIVPASFASLGMASPSLMFLSQSVLSHDEHMLVRVAHELSHSWFGLAIGPHDWHEEWLSEGFCTYTESVIHAWTRELTEEEFQEERAIYDNLKYSVLQAEIQSTGIDLQTLRNAGDDDKSAKYVSNGMNPDKGFLQLHYLKGYFLLRHLEDTVGCSQFNDFLKLFVETFRHKLIDSMDVLQLFFKTFPDVRSASLSEDTIFRDWLNTPGLPKKKMVCGCNDSWTKLHWRKRRKLDFDTKLQIPKLKQVQILLLLDNLLEEEKLNPMVLHHLNEKLGLSTSNADVQHKWCELVIKHKVQDSYKDVGHFLVHSQAMGVYLFGELIITRDREQRQLAEESFAEISEDMEEGVKNVVQTMVYGS